MKITVIIILWAFCTCIHAQSFQLSFQHIDQSSQLPDADINCLLEKDHLLYIGTEEGLFAFNGGMVFRIPLEQQGEKINVISLVKDPAGNLWTGTQNGLYIFTAKEQVIRVDRYANVELNYLQTIAYDASGNIWMLSGASDNLLFTYNIYSTRLHIYGHHFNTIRSYRQNEKGMQELWYKANKSTFRISLQNGHAQLKRFYHLDPRKETENYLVNDVYVDGGGNALISTDQGIKIASDHDMQVQQDFFDSIYPGNINAVNFYENKVFLCTAHDGLIILDLPTRQVISTYKKDPDDQSAISSNAIKFCHITDHCLYVVNTDHTIDYSGLTDNEFVYLKHPDKKGFRDMAAYHDRILLTGNDSMVYELEKERLMPYEKIQTPVQELQVAGQDLFGFYPQEIIRYTKDSTIVYKTGSQAITTLYHIEKNRDELFLNTDAGIYRLEKQTIFPLDGLKEEVYKWYEHFLFLDENTLLVNAYYSYFLVVKKQGNVYKPVKLIHHIEKVNQVIKLNDLVLIAGNEGISRFDRETDSIIPIKKSSGEKFYRIVPDGVEVFYTVSNREIAQCYFSGNRMVVMKTWNNLPAGYIENHDMLLKDHVLYMPMKKGVLCFYPHRHRYENYRLHINNIRISGKMFRTSWTGDTIHTGYEKSEISMDIGLWSSHIHPGTEIKYYLSRTDSGSVTAGRNSKIYFEKMNPGTHTLTIQASDHNGKVLAETSLVLIISRAWYQTPLFYLLLLAAFLLLAYAIFKWRLRIENEKTKKNELMLRKIKESENLALRSQMNPHFIFNTLNSINNYILNGDTENASHYLNKFSKLIRNTLDLTRSEKVTLAQEIQALKLYMDIEKARTNFTFDYEIHIDKNIEDDFIKLPPLIIQPFVENSIWHGLQGLEGRGKIDISIRKENNGLMIITVEDNGRGRDLERMEKKDKKSHGLNITMERLKVWHEKSYFDITDLVDAEKKPAGTRVMIYLYDT